MDHLTVYHSLLSSFLFPGCNISAFGLSTPGFATTLKLESSLGDVSTFSKSWLVAVSRGHMKLPLVY